MISVTVGQSSWEKEISFLIWWIHMQRIFLWELHIFYVASGLAGVKKKSVVMRAGVWSPVVTCFFYLPSSAIWLCFPPPWWERERAFPLWVRWHLEDRKRMWQFTSGFETLGSNICIEIICRTFRSTSTRLCGCQNKSSNTTRSSRAWLQKGLRGLQHIQLGSRAQEETVALWQEKAGRSLM